MVSGQKRFLTPRGERRHHPCSDDTVMDVMDGRITEDEYFRDVQQRHGPHNLRGEGGIISSQS